MASSKEESGTCAANLRGWPECGTTGYVLQQWWINSTGTGGEWRNVVEGNGTEPPDGVFLLDLADHVIKP